jgi:hypothetical protein
MTTKTYDVTSETHRGFGELTEDNPIQFSKVETCEVCGFRGTDVHEYPTYSNVLGRDTTEFQCKDITACLNRKYAGTYMEKVNA